MGPPAPPLKETEEEQLIRETAEAEAALEAELVYMLELGNMSRSDLQAVAKKHGIKANLKSEVIIHEICQQRTNLKSAVVTFLVDVVRGVKMEFEELMRGHMAGLERLAAKASKAFAQPGVSQQFMASLYKDAITTMTKAHEVAVSAIVVTAKSIAMKPACVGGFAEAKVREVTASAISVGTAELIAMKPAGAEGCAEAKVHVTAPKLPASKPAGEVVSVCKVAPVVYAAIWVGGVSKVVSNKQLQDRFRTKALVGRFHQKRNFGYAKVLVPQDEVDQMLSQDSSIGGCKIKVAIWKKYHPKRQKCCRGGCCCGAAW